MFKVIGCVVPWFDRFTRRSMSVCEWMAGESWGKDLKKDRHVVASGSSSVLRCEEGGSESRLCSEFC